VTANGAPFEKALTLPLSRAMHQRIKGGLKETDVNELAVIPTGRPSL
jgi:hypothetical protein